MDTKKTSRRYSRRKFIQHSAGGVAGALVAGDALAADLRHGETPASWKVPGRGFSNYGQPRNSRDSPIRWISADRSVAGNGVSWTPLHQLEGTITPNGLHFERHHNGVPEVDPATWKMTVFGQVGKALVFDLNALHRYPMTSRIAFIECGGNSNSMWHPQPTQAPAGYQHGLVSCSEWTGVPLSILLREAGLKPDAKWLVADGLDAAGVSISIPIAKAMDDTIVGLYQNGEPVRPENGFPARLLVPGWEGIVNVKWLNSMQLSDRPLMSRFDTVSYTDLQKNGTAERFTFEMGVKSLITSPSPGQSLAEPGFYELSGLAWTGNGVITRVEVSADGGNTWAKAKLQDPVLDKALTRFRAPWHWNGARAILKSRAYDALGRVQPEREVLLQEKGSNHYYHYNAIISWSVDTDGSVHHVYA
ncbi:MAG: sulfite dehydrogenase [Gammaproteobacteria bacterium]|nr:sulfite dehydrogenase [Gammaproteobacteria bacterium]